MKARTNARGASSPVPRAWQARARRVAAAARRLEAACGPAPELVVVLGSGFDGVRAALRWEREVPYARVPGFPQPAVPGHAGVAGVGWLAGRRLGVLAGRAHFYEGHDLETVTFPIRVLAQWGVRGVVLTNAAGGIHRRLRPGDFLLLRDHLNFMGAHPLRGSDGACGAGFVDLSAVYDAQWRALWRAAARETGVRLREGVYLAVSGPAYETPAEIRAFALWGADAVGMSTVPEAIVARQCGLRVAGLSCITNRAAGLAARPISHAEVLAVAARIRTQAARLLEAFVRRALPGGPDG